MSTPSCESATELELSIVDDYVTRISIVAITDALKQPFCDHVTKFKNLMKETGCFISGSFVMQCILHESWADSDIGIFIPVESFTKIHNFMINHMTYLYKTHVGGGTFIDKKIIDVADYLYGYGHGGRGRVRVISVDIGKTSQDISNYIDLFDLDVCKNAYYYDGTDHLIIKDLRGLLTKTTPFRFSPPQTESDLQNFNLGRYHKYQKRGFKFSNIEQTLTDNTGLPVSICYADKKDDCTIKFVHSSKDGVFIYCSK
jgi:hypothetical protein